MVTADPPRPAEYRKAPGRADADKFPFARAAAPSPAGRAMERIETDVARGRTPLVPRGRT